ncbi:signal recognition particle receptor subunit alpha, partial [bacterium]|nr:signal recognition particle receptor subunit alpha [bacterium]
MQSEWLIALGVLLVAAVVLGLWLGKRKAARPTPLETAPPEKPTAASAPVPDTGLDSALQKTRGQWWAGLNPLSRKRAAELQNAEWESLEEVLLTADVSLKATEKLLGAVRSKKDEGKALPEALEAEVAALLEQSHQVWTLPNQHPTVISVVGVNGVGKTTSVGKLAR